MPSGEDDEIPERAPFWLFFFAPAAVRAFLVFPTSDPSLVHGLGRLATSIIGQPRPDDRYRHKRATIPLQFGKRAESQRSRPSVTQEH
jgi:hypothetical protein